MKRLKRTFTQEERNLTFDLWKQGAGFIDIGAKRMAKRPKLGLLELCSELKQTVIDKLELKWSPEQISGWLRVVIFKTEENSGITPNYL